LPRASAERRLGSEATARSVRQPQRPADCDGELLGDGQAEARSAGVAAAGLFDAVEGLKDGLKLVGGNAGAVVDAAIRSPPMDVFSTWVSVSPANFRALSVRLVSMRRIATRYDKLARNFFSSVRLVVAMVYWM
jgi:hypothetical protein